MTEFSERESQVPDSQLPSNRDPASNPNLPRDENAVLRYTAGGAVYNSSGGLGAWVYERGPLSVLELDHEGGRLLPSVLGSVYHVRFEWSEVQRVEVLRSVWPWFRGVCFWLRGRDGFCIDLGLRRKALYKVLDFAESKGAEVRREAVFSWTGRPTVERHRR